MKVHPLWTVTEKVLNVYHWLRKALTGSKE